jgi:Protein of unknown function (DUF2484)
MSLSLTLACVWAVVTNVVAIMPSRDHHWRAAYILIALGLPIVGFVARQHGIWIGLAVLISGSAMLHWPVRYAWRWVRRKVKR